MKMSFEGVPALDNGNGQVWRMLFSFVRAVLHKPGPPHRPGWCR